MNYKLVICGVGFLQELELKEKDKGCAIGTVKGCIVRFDTRRVGEEFLIELNSGETGWRIKATSGVFFECNGKRFEDYPAKHGDKLHVCSAKNEKELFTIDYYIDFGVKNNDYDLKISLANDNSFRIGPSGCDIAINDSAIGSCFIAASAAEDGLLIDTANTRNMVSVNGTPVGNESILVNNGNFFSLMGYQFYLFNGELYTSSNGIIETVMPHSVVTYQQNHFNYPVFVKNVRQKYVIPQEEIEVLDPKAKKEPPEQNLVVTLLPTLLSMGMMVLMRSMMMSGRGFTMILFSVGMLVAGVGTSLITFITSNKKAKKDEVKREKDYREYLAEREEFIVNMREKEYALSCRKNPSLEEDIQHVADFDSRLFERKKDHDDFLEVRIGTGIVKSLCPVKYNTHEYVDTEDYLMDYPKSISDKYARISDMPVMLNLKDCNSIGFIGSRTKLYQMVKNITLAVSTEHFYEDVQMFYVMNPEDEALLGWARWLHNFSSFQGSLRNFMYDEDSAKTILEYLYAELTRREEMQDKDIKELPHVIIFAYRSERISSHPINRFYDEGAKLGFTFIFFEEYEEMVNDSCTKRIFLDEDANTGYIRDVEDGEIIQEFEYEHIPGDIAAQAALKLGCVYVDEISLSSALTKNITLFQLLNIMNVNDLELERRWRSSRIYESMAAPLGVKTGNEIVYLDLHEKYHGPHGLVAGTTGSGKSEILQTYICSMATLFHPYEVGFIIIDFKGGGMVNQFRELPHLNGAITNIDGREIDRSLLSIKAELMKRQELFAQYNVNKIDDYIKLFKKGEAKTALPHLILIVDEFAELKSDQPEFMKELISAARIGRSLGVHLILATQKPSGVVNDQIWSNSKFKLCLKVQTKEDSNEVLKSPLAAEIREPGRAYLQVGNNELFQLFQSAYSGAPARFDTLGNVKKFKLAKVNLCGKREILYEQEPKSSDANETQLDAIVKYVKDYCDAKNIVKLPNICLPPLEEVIPAPEKEIPEKSIGTVVRLGIYDNPSKQEQKVYSLDLCQTNVFLIGSSQYGKTSMIQTMIREIAVNYSPSDVCIYILDYASMFLRNFATLKHVGGVVTQFDDERFKSFMKMMLENMAIRRETLAKLGVTSFTSYREAGYTELPHIVIFLDNLIAFREINSKYEDDFINICRDGLSLGITVVAGSSVSSGIGFRYLSNFATRIAFTCNNSSEYSMVFDRCKMSPKEIPGRALVEVNKDIYECQMYLAFAAEKEFEKIAMMRKFIKDMNVKYAAFKNTGIIPEVPDVVTTEFIENLAGRESDRYEIPIGVDYSSVQPVFIPFAKTVQIGIATKEELGSNDLVRCIIKQMLARNSREKYDLYIADSVNKKLSEFAESEITRGYSFNSKDCLGFITEISEELQRRYEIFASGNEEEFAALPHIVLVIDSMDAIEAIGFDMTVSKTYSDIVKKYKNLKVTVIISCLENTSVNYNLNEVIKSLKDNRILFTFEEASNIKLFDVSIQFMKENSKKLAYKDVYMAASTDVVRIKTVTS